MRLLLDTHVLIWWDQGARLSREALRAIREADEVFVSSVSAWEIEIKRALGKVVANRTIAEAAQASGFSELPVLMRHTEQLRGLEPLHRDPFDRLLVAQARSESVVLVTRDPQVLAYGVPTIRA
ncbi:MAG: type II toxin-antitoxin system VapC family toxin [Gemmatimonas sp.]|uniref:type II toxin-antitoxin system VapC family toxin n=1 Tax=Gemmatimonas sp. TaxID=1962908 RepID=UPI00391F3DBA|nr:type II toxin-antitoxin system VapC family toxin [Gemmatimonadota bacterium]